MEFAKEYLKELLDAHLKGLITKQECCELLFLKLITANSN